MSQALTFTVPPEAAGRRLDAFLGATVAGVSRQRLKKWIQAGLVTLDGKAAKPRHLLEGGETVNLPTEAAADPDARPEPVAGVLDLLYADPHLVVLDKPAGLTVHPAPGLTEATLVHRLIHRFPGLALMEGERPGIVHRLDKDTSGLMAVALTEADRLALAKAFAERRVKKEYLALVHGAPDPAEARLDAPIGRDPAHKTRMAVVAESHGGRPALSHYRTLARYGSGGAVFSLLAVRIHTGRTHQIRVHLAHAGHPIVADRLYGGGVTGTLGKLTGRQLLHARRLAFAHPATGAALDFRAPAPKAFLRAALFARRRAQRVVVTGLPGSGKSALAAMLAERGADLFSADRAVAELYAPGADGWTLLHRRFGPDIAPQGRAVDKAALAERMRREDRARREVETLIHPLVRHRLETFWDRSRARLAVAEIPLYFEAGFHQDADAPDAVVCVDSDDAARHTRLAERGWDVEAIAAVDAWQWPRQAKAKAARLVVDNHGGLDDLNARAEALWQELRRERAAATCRDADAFRRLAEGADTEQPG